ncbi:hypothetical protein CAPTEDRAFT_190654 [Capitella teleta]|uniref:Uncharacterized protein n=1 Tax=Capitella teleta TaxID=283909 RepID=R7TCP2_CAPTE|nr:hypothetical protein CAPTEDRAFT_190654 [Capitella teleta]|eukprot:ELT88841.1 hypothetical protein CAPTEDRAFT_190654 [Capitella teleta]
MSVAVERFCQSLSKLGVLKNIRVYPEAFREVFQGTIDALTAKCTFDLFEVPDLLVASTGCMGPISKIFKQRPLQIGGRNASLHKHKILVVLQFSRSDVSLIQRSSIQRREFVHNRWSTT